MGQLGKQVRLSKLPRGGRRLRPAESEHGSWEDIPDF